jgi:hypothetical protein
VSIHNEWTLVIDSLRTIQLASTTEGKFVLTVEDPHSVAIVEVSPEELGDLRDEFTKRLAR